MFEFESQEDVWSCNIYDLMEKIREQFLGVVDCYVVLFVEDVGFLSIFMGLLMFLEWIVLVEDMKKNLSSVNVVGEEMS